MLNDLDQDFDDDYFIPHFKVEPKKPKCKYCGSTDVFWENLTGNHWRLKNNSGEFHICSDYTPKPLPVFQENEWINIKDHVPEDHVLVLVFRPYSYGSGGIAIDSFSHGDFSKCPRDSWLMPTYWMPLPKEPQDKSRRSK